MKRQEAKEQPEQTNEPETRIRCRAKKGGAHGQGGTVARQPGGPFAFARKQQFIKPGEEFEIFESQFNGKWMERL